MTPDGSRVAVGGRRGLAGGALVLALSMGTASVLWGQRVRRELGVQGYTLLGTDGRFGVGLIGALRVGPRARVSLFAGADGGTGRMAGRAEALGHLLLSPGRKRGVGGYLAGGLAVDLVVRPEARIVALVGIEDRPGGRSGWALEAGVGGGWRVAAGWRWRR